MDPGRRASAPPAAPSESLLARRERGEAPRGLLMGSLSTTTDGDVPALEAARLAGAAPRIGAFRSTYEAELCSADPADLTARCLIALGETAINRNTARAADPSALISRELYLALRAEAAAEGAAAVRGEPEREEQVRSTPIVAAAVAAAASAAAHVVELEEAQLLAEAQARDDTQRRPPPSITREFFTPGGLDGPNPGARSAQGEADAQQFFVTAPRSSDAFRGTHAAGSGYAAAGYRLNR